MYWKQMLNTNGVNLAVRRKEKKTKQSVIKPERKIPKVLKMLLVIPKCVLLAVKHITKMHLWGNVQRKP